MERGRQRDVFSRARHSGSASAGKALESAGSLAGGLVSRWSRLVICSEPDWCTGRAPGAAALQAGKWPAA